MSASPLRAALDAVIAEQGCLAASIRAAYRLVHAVRGPVRVHHRIEGISHDHLTREENTMAAADTQITITRIRDLRNHAPIGVAYAECRRRELPSEL